MVGAVARLANSLTASFDVMADWSRGPDNVSSSCRVVFLCTASAQLSLLRTPTWSVALLDALDLLRTLSHQPQRGQLSSYRARHALNRMALSRTVSNLVSHLVVQEMTIPLQSKPSVRRFALPHRLLCYRRWSTPRQPRTQVVGCAYGGMRTHTKRATKRSLRHEHSVARSTLRNVDQPLLQRDLSRCECVPKLKTPTISRHLVLGSRCVTLEVSFSD